MIKPLSVAVLCLISALLLTTACSAPMTTSPPPAAAADKADDALALTLPSGYRAELLVDGLLGPTQMIFGPDEQLWVAQLAGGENANTGEVVVIDLVTETRTTLLTGLDKPTGIALLDDALWIATRRDLLRAPLDADGLPGVPEVVLADLPFNGRSNGALTVTPSGRLLYETSGARLGNAAQEGSAALWQLDPTLPLGPDNPQALATGLKGAYAHAFDAAGRLWTTEIGDDLVNGSAPFDELNLVIPGADFGWPQCFGMQEAAVNYGGTAERCAMTRAPVLLFPPRSTPTGIVASPWEEDVLFVALWLEGSVMRIAITTDVEIAPGNNAVGMGDVWIDNLRNPQHLLATDDGALLVSDFTAGAIYRITQE